MFTARYGLPLNKAVCASSLGVDKDTVVTSNEGVSVGMVNN